MCLKINKEFNSMKEAENFIKNFSIASKEIKVYKILENLNKLKTKGESPFACFEYEKGFQYTESNFTFDVISERKNDDNKYFLNINQGLHAYRKKDSFFLELHLKQFRNCFPEIIEMYIPKGAKYYIGNKGDIVTNQLIWY